MAIYRMFNGKRYKYWSWASRIKRKDILSQIKPLGYNHYRTIKARGGAGTYGQWGYDIYVRR